MKPSILTSGLIAAVAIVGFAGSAVAGEPINETRAAAADGSVVIENIKGTVVVEGWDRNEIAVTGTLGDGAERLEIGGTESRTKIEVVIPKGMRHLRVEDTDLNVKVPRKSRVQVGGVNTDIDLSKVEGRVELETVNGDIAVSGDPELVDVETVNGDIEIDCATERVEVQSVSGEVTVLRAQGDVSASTVSGDIEVRTGRILQGDFASVSGDITFEADLGEDGALEFESHSGTVVLMLPGNVSAEFDVSTFSGDIVNELGPEAERTSRYAPGKELSFSVGSGDAEISVSSFSGTVKLMKR